MSQQPKHEWTKKDKQTLQDFGLVYSHPSVLTLSGTVDGWTERHSETAYGIRPVISLIEPGYVRAYKVWVATPEGEHDYNRTYKAYVDLPSALMEFARWQGRGQAEEKLKTRLEAVRELIEGEERYAPV